MRCVPPAELGHSKTEAHDKIHSGDAGLEIMNGPGEGFGGPLCCVRVPLSLESTSEACFVLQLKFVLHVSQFAVSV